MGKGKDKKIRGGNSSNKKDINIIPPQYELNNPVFLFNRVDRDGDYAFKTDRTDGEDLDTKRIIDFLIHYSKRTWADIERDTHDDGRSKHHFQKDKTKFSKEANERIKKMQIDDEVNSGALYSFSLTNKMRVWGLRYENRFYILWYDPKHEVYPIKK